MDKKRTPTQNNAPWNKGLKLFPLTKEHKRKISKALVGHKVSKETKRKLSLAAKNRPNNRLGCKLSEKTKNKIRLALLGKERKDLKGKRHWWWKGGITPFIRKVRNCLEMKKWRKNIFERDNYICFFCRQKGGILNADHIKSFNLIIKENNIKSIKRALKCKELWNLNNGRTLCEKCHKQTDNYGEKAKIKN